MAICWLVGTYRYVRGGYHELNLYGEVNQAYALAQPTALSVTYQQPTKWYFHPLERLHGNLLLMVGVQSTWKINLVRTNINLVSGFFQLNDYDLPFTVRQLRDISSNMTKLTVTVNLRDFTPLPVKFLVHIQLVQQKYTGYSKQHYWTGQRSHIAFR